VFEIIFHLGDGAQEKYSDNIQLAINFLSEIRIEKMNSRWKGIEDENPIINKKNLI
jgi:hypothetical protein